MAAVGAYHTIGVDRLTPHLGAEIAGDGWHIDVNCGRHAISEK